MKQSVRCNFSRCNQEGTKICRTCITVSYCSDLCRQKDLNYHIHICSASQSERIKKMCGLIALCNGDDDDDDESNLSHVLTVNSLIYDGEVHNLCAFRHTDLWLPYTDARYCGICRESSGYHPQRNGHLSYENKKISYHRCFRCAESDATLCDNTFLETTCCAMRNKRGRISVFHVILYRDYIMHMTQLNNDIISVILNQLIGLIRCLNCIQIKK